MDFKIITHEGIVIDVNGGPAIEVFYAQLNQRELLTLALGNEVFAKDMFKTIIPAAELVGEYEVHTKDGGVYLTDIIDYNAQELSELTNSSNGTFMLIGNIIVQRHNLKRIKKADVLPV